MALQTDISGDHAYIDGVETVTFSAANPGEAPISDVKGLQRQLSRSDIAAGAAIGIEPNDTVWHVWEDRGDEDDLTTALGRKPRNGDSLTTSDGATWRILDGTYSSLTMRWRFVCREEVSE